MEVEAGGTEREVVGVAVGGFEVTIGVEIGGIPEAAAEIGEEWELRPQLSDFSDEDGVLVDGAEGVVEAVVSPLYAPGYFVYVLIWSLLFHFHSSSNSRVLS